MCLVGLSVCFCDSGRRLAAVWWSVWPVFGRMREKQLPVPCRGMISEAEGAGGV